MRVSRREHAQDRQESAIEWRQIDRADAAPASAVGAAVDEWDAEAGRLPAPDAHANSRRARETV